MSIWWHCTSVGKVLEIRWEGKKSILCLEREEMVGPSSSTHCNEQSRYLPVLITARLLKGELFIRADSSSCVLRLSSAYLCTAGLCCPTLKSTVPSLLIAWGNGAGRINELWCSEEWSKPSNSCLWGGGVSNPCVFQLMVCRLGPTKSYVKLK